MRKILTACLILLQSCLLAQDYNIISYGAIAGGKILNSKAIQLAIDEAHRNGGGKVIVPAGTFLTGGLHLKSNVEFHLTKKAIILGSSNLKDYPIVDSVYSKKNPYKALVMAYNADNISITGKGTIDGQGAQLGLHIDSLFYVGLLDSSLYSYKERRPNPSERPQLMQFAHCRNTKMLDVTVKNASCWVVRFDSCRNVLIKGAKIESDAYWNNDGIDIVDCFNVHIKDSDINVADDGVCLKSHPYNQKEGVVMCDSILIENCRIRTSASAVKFGTYSFGGFKNVVIRDIKVKDTFRSAIAIEMVDGGHLENILVENVKAKNTGNAIFIRLGNRRGKGGVLKNVVIRDMKVTVPKGIPDENYEIRGPMLPFFHNVFPSSITGIPGYRVENVLLENIKITYPGGGNKAYANLPTYRLQHVPENEDHYPEFSMFGELPAWSFYVRHADGLTFKNIKLKIKEKDYRPAFVFDDVNGLKMESIEVTGDNKPNPIFLKDVTSYEFVD